MNKAAHIPSLHGFREKMGVVKHGADAKELNLKSSRADANDGKEHQEIRNSIKKKVAIDCSLVNMTETFFVRHFFEKGKDFFKLFRG